MAAVTHPRVERVSVAGTGVGARIALALVLSLMTAGMLILAFPPANVWPLAFCCFVPMLVAQFRLLPRRWSFVAPIAGVDLWVLWLMIALFGVSTDTAFLLVIPVIAAGKDVLGARANRRFHERTRYRWFVLEGMAGWVGFEMIRSFIPLVRTNGFIGYTVHTQPWMLQGMSLVGVYGLDLLIVLVNYALAQGVMAWMDRRAGGAYETPAIAPALSRRWLAAAAIVLVAWAGLGAITLTTAPADAPTLRAAGVSHPFSSPGHLDDEAQQPVRLASLSEQTRLAAQEGAALVVWPELAVGFDPRAEHTAEVQALARETQAHVAVAFGRATQDESRNATVIVTPAGEFLAVVGKHHPAPGEGHDPDEGVYLVHDTPLGALATLICNDANFTDSARILARQGAQVIAASTLETSIKGMETMYYVQTVFRAVENRVAVVTAGNLTTALIDPYGRILAKRAHPTQRGDLPMLANVPLGDGKGTLYTRLGDWLGWASLAGFIFFAVYPDALKRRDKRLAAATEGRSSSGDADVAR